jgi:hypothetical protein
MDEINLDELAAGALLCGYDRQNTIRRLLERIERDCSYLRYRKRRGRQTSYDYMLAEDVAVAALVVLLLQGKQVL